MHLKSILTILKIYKIYGCNNDCVYSRFLIYPDVKIVNFLTKFFDVEKKKCAPQEDKRGGKA